MFTFYKMILEELTKRMMSKVKFLLLDKDGRGIETEFFSGVSSFITDLTVYTMSIFLEERVECFFVWVTKCPKTFYLK